MLETLTLTVSTTKSNGKIYMNKSFKSMRRHEKIRITYISKTC